MKKLIFQPRPVILTDNRFKREPTRPPAFQSSNFAEQFDYHTFLFDSFFCGPNEILLTAPPFYNLLPSVQAMEIVAFPSQQNSPFRIRNVDRHSQIRISVPAGTSRVSLRSEIGQFEIEPERNLAGFFCDRRVLFTLSQNNKLQWIQDWVRYNRDIHGADAVLFYDNQSNTYSPQELLEAIAGIAGIERVCVVSWPFLYGPQGLDSKRYWDSDFCQNGAWEHARWMFLGQARSAMNSDIDELVVSTNGASVFEAAERSWAGAVRYPGYWVHGFDGINQIATDETPIRALNFDHYLRPVSRRKWGVFPASENVCPTKWTVVPCRCPKGAQWTAHRIRGWLNALPKSRNFSFRHFREINNHWKYDRSAREVFDANRYVFDHQMRSNFANVQWTS
jgi:hypothetical protein